MNLDELTLGQIKQIQMLLPPVNQVPKTSDHGIKIVVLDRGFVYVGKVSTDSDWCYISNAKNIRVWGTSKGLGELAESGPLSGTKMDACGDVQAPLRAVIHLIAVEASQWSKHF
jgi:hypothetical protein